MLPGSHPRSACPAPRRILPPICRQINVDLLYFNICKVRASYPIVDHRERFVAPHSLCFSSDGSKIICGSTSLITVFSLSLPGTVYASFQTASSRRDASNTAQKGIISAMAINPDYSHVLATGTFQGSIGLYADEGQGEVISVFSAHEQTGITQVEWSSCGRYLFVASRRSNIIEVWDIRDYRRSLTSFTGREAMTNQRLGLSKTFDGSRMVSGGIDGVVKTWDMNFTLDPRPESVSSWKAHQGRACSILSYLPTNTSEAPIGTAACHPSYSLIATCGGSRASPFDTSNDSEDDADEMVVEAVESHIDHTLRIWSYS